MCFGEVRADKLLPEFVQSLNNAVGKGRAGRAMGYLCQGKRKGHPWLPELGPGFGAAPSLKPYTCSRAVLSSCLA